METINKPSALPPDWTDDMKMTVMFSPFRDKNLNPKSWDQKIKFWSELIVEECKQSQQALINVQQLREKFRRKEKSPSCLDTVLQEMLNKGQVKKLSDLTVEGSDGWLSWGYNRLVKKPVGWSLKWLSREQEQKQPPETYVIMDVIKRKAEELVERRHRLSEARVSGIVEYDTLQAEQTDLCPTSMEFNLVMRQLEASKQVVIQTQEDGNKIVKFIEKEAQKKKIDEQDLHIHRIQKAHDDLKSKIETLLTETKRLAAEAIAYKQKGMTKLAMSCMRKRRLGLSRVDKLTGSMDTLDNILHRIKEAESNEMVLKAIEGGTKALQGLNSRTSADDVSSVMDNLADATQTQEEILMELSTASYIDEPSQEELEEELSIILQDDTPPRQQNTPTRLQDTPTGLPDTPTGLPDVPSGFRTDRGHVDGSFKDSGSLSDLNKMLDDLQLPDVPTTSPSATKHTDRQALTS
ncbi:charged multivesicular body protein 7-like [Mya arenaria]|uniref:charged multivesicular body protein 7-like n=1 Tax=Mya arenaria TaxID=6604 RepID=UPI0022DF3853|nr:charged multivesicular body protein 7-like [Mya arenaria]